MSIGVAIIGGGIFAREEHLPAVQSSKHLTLKAVYSRSLKSAESLGTGASVDLFSEDSGKGKGYDDLLARSDIHAVIIALPILSQPEYIKKAILAGKHVLSEKPIAKDIDTAQGLMRWYQENAKGATWAVAENCRYLTSFHYAQEQIQKLGRLMQFRMKVHSHTKGGKYFETAWRKVPEYQGGFLLDGGVHDVAALRLLLGSDYITHLTAFSNQLQPHLPPVDTLDATLKTKSGATGTLSRSFGTNFPRSAEWAVAGDNGSVILTQTGYGADDTQVKIIDNEGHTETKSIQDERTGVPPEIRAWGEALAAGKQNKDQSPEEALADLELIERMLRSGENNGAPQACSLQNL